ncbi:MAG: NPCBM-associated, NEW3 domain of alpha-galactosidase [Methanoregula sp. PtaU1.Bin051]|nr:MAG: NPCBM-associated, NEW3 domain of alpha-galactosidase [Methanoregula sp. PtaU1.Bin051]
MDIRIVAVILLLACCSMPALAAVKYIDSSPELSALITGSNEFTPGQDVTFNIVLQNSGLNTFKFVNSGTIARDDLPNTAKLVTVQLLPGTAPVTIKTDPQMVGDIPGTGRVQLAIDGKIANNAPAGEYQLPLFVQYKYLETTRQEASDNMQFIYKEVNQTLPLIIKVKPLLKIRVLEASTDSLNVGSEGYLRLRIKNDGSDDGRKATIIVTRSGSSPITPTDSSVFVGDFLQDSEVTCSYKVAVSNDAEAGTYPIDVAVTYEDHEGSVVTSSTETIGVPVGGKAGFTIPLPPPEIEAGNRAVIAVEYKNTGGMTVYHAQARINIVPPFSSNDDTAYLGDLKAGESATARYEISVLPEADPKDYTLDSEVRYRDALDNSQIADTVKVTVRVIEKAGGNPLTNPAILLALTACFIGAGYYLFVMRKKL